MNLAEDTGTTEEGLIVGWSGSPFSDVAGYSFCLGGMTSCGADGVACLTCRVSELLEDLMVSMFGIPTASAQNVVAVRGITEKESIIERESGPLSFIDGVPSI